MYINPLRLQPLLNGRERQLMLAKKKKNQKKEQQPKM